MDSILLHIVSDEQSVSSRVAPKMPLLCQARGLGSPDKPKHDSNQHRDNEDAHDLSQGEPTEHQGARAVDPGGSKEVEKGPEDQIRHPDHQRGHAGRNPSPVKQESQAEDHHP
jgi:hypothetical protein